MMAVPKKITGMAIVIAVLGAACAEDDCVYCGVDISKGVRYGTDATVPVTDKDTVSPDTEKPDATLTDHEQDEDAIVPDEEILLPVDRMVTIEGTTFMMGCEEGVAPHCAETNATPRHEVTVASFEIDIYEVTKKEFESCIAAGACKNEQGEPAQFSLFGDEHPFCLLGGDQPDDMPANCVSWDGARAYCEWLGKRLPSEAEWELAARGTDDRWYPWGDAPGPTCSHVVMEDETDWGCGSGGAMAVGSKEDGKSPFGLYDMAGNMWEWVEDDWHDDYDDPSRPDDGSAWVDAVRPANRVQRGGAFLIGSEEAFEFLAYGHYGAPAENTGVSYGFRCARSLP